MATQSPLTGIDIYNHPRVIEGYLRKAEESQRMSPANKETIKTYYRSMINDALRMPTIIKHLQAIIVLGDRIEGKPFHEMTREDFEKIVFSLRSNPRLSPHSVHRQLICFRKFYKWQSGGETYPDCVKWIRPNASLKNGKLPDSLLTQEEVKKMINAARHPRDLCLLSILNELGCRVGELLGIDVRHIEDCGEYYRVTIQHSKTTPRKLKLIDSKPFIAKWLNIHPRKEGSNSPLFIKIGSVGIGKRMPYFACRALIRKIAVRAGVDKGVNPHNWRHSTATRYAGHFSYSNLCYWFGWVIGSKTASVYVHLNGRDLDGAVDEMRGKKTVKRFEDTLTVKTCQQCRLENGGINDLCERCGAALTLNGVFQKEDRMEKMELEIKARQKVLEEYMRFQNEKIAKLESTLPKE